MERRVREINKKHFRRRRWHKITTIMAALAAFCTTYALILPAITMSRQLICGMEEHSHTPECYIQQPVCACGLEEAEGHTHGQECYQEQETLVCGLEETQGHDHGESCYEETVATVCGLEEGESHTHGNACTATEEYLICTLEDPEHTHGDGCYGVTAEIICGEEEGIPHIHADACFAIEQKLICGQEVMAAHTHMEDCQGISTVLWCTLPEAEPHTHDESCYGLEDVASCDWEEHTHSEFCYDIGPADPAEDVETPADWEQLAQSLSGDNAADVAALALSQLGYRESNRNYVYIDEITLNGYTRYGDWYGDPYGDWNAMFASFVLHYAGVEDLGQASDPAIWAEQLAHDGPQHFRRAGEHMPAIGDMVFLDRDLDGGIDTVGILTALQEDLWQVTAGDIDDAVSQLSYAPGDSRIVGYGLVATAEDGGEAQDTPTEDTADETTETTAYTLTYVANNGTEEMLQQQTTGPVTLGWETLTAPEGMEFLVWNTETDGSGTDYENGAELTLTEDLTLYAQWTKPLPMWSTFNLRSTAAAAAPTIGISKQIEKLSNNTDDYSYRLHLTMDGSSLSAGSVTTVTPTKRRIGIIIDATETMTATSLSGASTGKNKFQTVQELLKGSEGFLNSILDEYGNTYVSVIAVGATSGGSYTSFTKEIAAGEDIGDFSNINENLHYSHPISYVSGLLAAEKYLGNDIDSLVFIVGNSPESYVKYSDGQVDRTINTADAPAANYEDYVKFMKKHEGLKMYMVGIKKVEGGDTTAREMAAYSETHSGGGGYYEADSVDALKQQLQNIAQQIVVPADKVKSITISDPLSEYVVLNGNGNITAQLVKLDADGNVTGTTDITDKVSITDGLLTCAYADEIEGPFKIEIGFDIQLAEGVYQREETDYPHKGDSDTDKGDNATSSGQPGFYSNGEATATYTLNDSATATTSDFPHPVVQAPEKALIIVSKTWIDAAEDDKQPVTVVLHRGSPEGESAGTLVLNQENNWTAQCEVRVYAEPENAEKNKIYPVENTVEGFTASYSPTEVAVEADGSYTLNVTNTKQVVERSASLTVHKLWQGVPGTQDAVIHVCTGDGVSAYTEVDGSPFRVSNSQEASKTFTITWTGETAPTIYIYEEHSAQFYPVTGGDGEAQNIVVGEQQHPARVLTVEKDGSYTVTLTNMAVAQMPATGGPGTGMYVFSGTALIFSTLLLMQIQKRKPERRARKSSFL